MKKPKTITIITTLLAALLLAACSSSSDEVSPDNPGPTPADAPVTFSTYITSDKSTRGNFEHGTLRFEHGTLNFEHGKLNFEHSKPKVQSSNLKVQSSMFKPQSSMFNAPSSKSLYGEITSVEALSKVGFGVFGYYTGAADWKAAGATTDPNFMYNQQVTWNNFDASGKATSASKENSAGQTPKWIYEPVKFWPNNESTAASEVADDKVSFFSYAPFLASSESRGSRGARDTRGTRETRGTRAPEDTRDASTIALSDNNATGSPRITYHCGSDPEKSIDLLWGVKPRAGLPYLDQTKQKTTEDIDFEFKHALAKLNIIMYGNFGSSLGENDSTMVLLKKVRITHRVPKEGALDLNNTEAGTPAWDKSTFVYDNTTDDDATEDFNEENSSTIELADSDIPDTLKDIDYGTDPAGWKARFNKGLGGIRNNKNFNLHKGSFMIIPPDSAEIAALPAGDRVLRVEVTYTVQTIDRRLPNKYWRHEETVAATYPVHRIQAGMAYTIRLGLSLSAVSITVKTEQWREPVVFANSVDPLDDNNFDIDPTPDSVAKSGN